MLWPGGELPQFWRHIHSGEEAFGGSPDLALTTHVSVKEVIPQLPIFWKAGWNPVLCSAVDGKGWPHLSDGCHWGLHGVPRPGLPVTALGSMAEWQALNKNSCSRQQSNKSNPIYSLPWDVPESWKVHLWQFAGLVTFSAISFACSSKARGFIEWEIEMKNEKKKSTN